MFKVVTLFSCLFSSFRMCSFSRSLFHKWLVLLCVFLCFSSNVNAVSSPEIIALTIDSPSVDVSEEEQTVTVAVSLKDENGVVSANLLFNQSEFGLFHYSQSNEEWIFDTETQTYNSIFTFVFDASHAAGTWELVIINSTVDPADNETHIYYSAQELVALAFEPNLTLINTNEVDTTAPELVSLEMSSLSIDVTSGQQTVVVNAALADVNTIANGSFWFNNPQIGLQVYPVASSKWVFNNQNQLFEASFNFVFESHHIAGDWELTSTGYISDLLNNQTFDYDSSVELIELGFPSILEIINRNVIDTIAPKLISFDVTPHNIDITTGAKVVEITASIEDDNGIENANVWLRHSETNDVMYSSTTTGWVLNPSTGNYDANFTFDFEQSQISGQWQALFISDVSDPLQNKSYDYDTADELVALGFNPNIDVISLFGLDSIPPVLNSLSISPQAIDVSSGEQAVIVMITLKDDIAIGNAEFWFRRTEFGLHLYPKTSTGWVYDSNYDLHTATFTYVFDTNKVSGTWEFSAVGGITDERGNVSYSYDSSTELTNLGFDSTLEVTNTNIVDITPPKLTSILISPENIDVSEEEKIVEVHVSFQDDNGLGNADFAFRHSAIGSFEAPKSSTEWEYNSETNTYDAVFSFVFNEEHESGSWQIMTVNPVTDELGNRSYDYDTALELLDQGFDITLELFNSNKLDESAPELVALDILPASVDVTLGEQTVIVNLSIKDENGIGKADFAFFRPEFDYVLTPVSSSEWLYNRELGTFDQNLTFVFSNQLVAGNWEFFSVNEISDANGHATDRYNSSAKLMGAGFQPHLFLINSQFVDTNAPELTNITIGVPIVNLDLATEKINVDVDFSIKDTTGIGHANFGLSSPDGNILKLPKSKTLWIYDNILENYQATFSYEIDSNAIEGLWSLISVSFISDDLPDTYNNLTYAYDSVEKMKELGFKNELFVINSSPEDSTPPSLVSLTLDTQEIDVSSGIKTVTAKAIMKDDSGIANAEFWLYQANLGKYLEADTNTEWVLNTQTNEYEATFSFIFNDNTGNGNWQLLARGAVSDVLGHSTTEYTALDTLLAMEFSPFLSVNDGFIENVFDSKTSTIYDYSRIAQEQTNKFSFIIEEAQTYELWVLANDETELIDAVFTGAESIEQSCVALSNKLRCEFTASDIDNIDDGIIATVKSRALDRTNFNIRAFLNPDSDQIETNWFNNRSSFPEIDVDGDGINNNLDTDDDGDGVIDTLDSHPYDASEFEDFDGDAIGNNADTDDDNDDVIDELDAFPFNPLESADTDADGIGNNADTDDDGDGILDTADIEPLNFDIGDEQAPIFGIINDLTIEAKGKVTAVNLVTPSVSDNNLNAPVVTSNASASMPIGMNEVIWTATDFVGNVTTATQLVNVQDTQGPVFDKQDALVLNARGLITRVTSDVEIFATDIVDGKILSSFEDADLKSGYHTAAISAQDSSGNITNSQLIIKIHPLVLLGADSNVEAGSSYSLPVQLSGKAAVYPVKLTYKVNGINQKIVSFDEEQPLNISISIPSTANTEDKLIFELVSASNAVLTSDKTVNLTVTNNNISPSVNMVVEQNDITTTIIGSSQGIVTATTLINDVNQSNKHSVVWEVSDEQLVDLATDGKVNTFEFDPELLPPNTYTLQAVVTENNTSESHQITATTTLTLVDNMRRLSTVTDSDEDGVFDATEGQGDGDQDGIPDYLDNDSDPTRLPINGSIQPLQTSIGLQLSLGDIVRSSNGTTSEDSSITVYDLAQQIADSGNVEDNTQDDDYLAISDIVSFNVTGLPSAGDSVPVVFPLAEGNVISDSSVYRKYALDKGWFDFVADSKNSISSANKDTDGNCPLPLSSQYRAGLNTGDNCILLIIEDGGNNDADGLSNGIVKDPGVLAELYPNEAPVINVSNQLSVNEGEMLSIDASKSRDTNGNKLSFLWEQISGVDIDLTNGTSETVSFTAPEVSSKQVVEIKLTVSDGELSSNKIITVNINNVTSQEESTQSSEESGGAFFWLLIVGIALCTLKKVAYIKLR